MMKHTNIAALLCAGLMLLAGCGRQETAQKPLQTGCLDMSDLNEGEPYSQELAGSYEMADENADAPAEQFTKYESPDGEVFLYDNAGRLRRYTASQALPAAASPDSLMDADALRKLCDDALASYIPDYAEYTEITSQYYEDGSSTYNLAMEREIADGIADYALIRLDPEGSIYDISISYADSDDACAEESFVTDADKADFEAQVQPYLTALDDYSAEVTYIHYKHTGGKLYAFYEISYTDKAAGITAGLKQVIFTRK